MNKYFLIFLSTIAWGDCVGHCPSEDLNSIHICGCEENYNEESDMQKDDYLSPLLCNYRIQGPVHRMWLLFASCPEYAFSDEREYLEKLKQGLLTEEEILYPILPAMNHEWQETRAADLAKRDENWSIIKRSEPEKLPKKPRDFFEVEDSSDTNRPTMRFHIDDNFLHEHPDLCLKLQKWAESFESEALEQVQQRSDIRRYRLLLRDYWAVAPLYAALETSQFPWLKNILVITDTYDYTAAFNVSMRIVLNSNGFWGPVVVLRINPRKFMDEATKPDAHDVVRQIASVALGYYCKECLD